MEVRCPHEHYALDQIGSISNIAHRGPRMKGYCLTMRDLTRTRRASKTNSGRP
jgi:hypothetical protein